MNKQANVIMAGVLAASVLTISGCGLVGSDKKSSPIDPSATAVPAPANDAANQVDNQDVAQTLYFADEKGYVVPVQMKIPKDSGPALEALKNMQEGSAGETQMNGTGLHAVIPKDSKFTLDINKDSGLATIDVSKNTLADLKTVNQQQQFVDAVVWELTSFSTVKNVQFTFGGTKVDQLTADGRSIPVGTPISRSNGINLEVSSGLTSPTDSTSVTLYFPSVNTTGTYHYLVPVTRMIPNQSGVDAVTETISQLEQGPESSQLMPVFDSGAQVVNHSVKGDTVSVDFSNPFTSKTDSTGELAARSLVLSLTENTGTQKVAITVNGKAPQLFKNFDFTKPVMRPTYINKDL